MGRVYRPRSVGPSAIGRWMKGAVVLSVRYGLVWLAVGLVVLLAGELRRLGAAEGWATVVDLTLLTVSVPGCFACILLSGGLESWGGRRLWAMVVEAWATTGETFKRAMSCVLFLLGVVLLLLLMALVSPNSDETRAEEWSVFTLGDMVLILVMWHTLAGRRWFGPGAFSFVLSKVLGFGQWRADRIERLGEVLNTSTTAFAYFAMLATYVAVSNALRLAGVPGWVAITVNLALGSNFLWLCFKDIYLHDDEEPRLVTSRQATAPAA